MKKQTFVATEGGRLDVATGEVFNEHGDVVAKLERSNPEDERSLSDYVATLYHRNTARQAGNAVRMTDSEGDERLINMDLAQGDVHTDAALPNYAAGYKLAQGVADIAAPFVRVSKASNKYNTWDSANAFKRVLPNQGTSGGAVAEVNPTLAIATYSTNEYALGAFIPQNVIANADSPLKPQLAAAKRVMNALMLEREIRVATLLTTSANFDASVVTTLGAAFKWNGGVSADPVADIHLLMEASYMPVTGIVMSERVAHAFVRNPNVQKYTQYKDGVVALDSALGQIAAVLQLPKMYRADMKYQASGTAMSYVWGNDVVLLHSPPEIPPQDQEDVATAYTFRWDGGEAPDGTVTAGFQVRQYFNPSRGARGGMQIVVLHNDAEVVTSKFVGGVIKAAYQ